MGGQDEPGGRHLPSAWGRQLPGAIPFLPWPVVLWWVVVWLPPNGGLCPVPWVQTPVGGGYEAPGRLVPPAQQPARRRLAFSASCRGGGALGAVRGPSALLAARTARIMQQGAARARTARAGRAAPAGVGERGGTGGGSGGRGRWMDGGGGSYRAPAGPTTLQSGGAAAGVLGAPPRGLRPPPVRFWCGGGEAKATRGHDTWCIGREV